MNVFTPGDHGSTFGGNPIAAAVGLTALTILEDEHLIERSATLGDYFHQQLKTLNYPCVKAVRGRGLMQGVEIAPGYSARALSLAFMEHGVLTKDTHETVLRFVPPLIITAQEIDAAIEVMREVFSKAKSAQ